MSRQARLGELIAILSIEDMKEVYKYVDLNGDVDSINRVFREALLDAGYSRDYEKIGASFEQLPLPKEDRETLDAWGRRLYFGIHAEDIDISCWLKILHALLFRGIEVEGADPAGKALIADMLGAYKRIQDDGYARDVSRIKESPIMSSLDKKILETYNFNYFDDFAGNDPFLTIKAVRAGMHLIRLVGTAGVFSTADFPFDALRAAGQKLITEDGIWMPPGAEVCDIRAVVDRSHIRL
ncbi:hypothetical protein SAMN05518854_1308 [Variovorax sp. YR266]|uniref:hypothetical protein n=1 Tax=Variovorax sp. YR266 TaxID=1884386 RepID=UPI000894EE1E|nr:hypothetical protein [Variovorax sp. YR266]SDZ72377.1 hypothetical protein SAMN05518854_1308 [Variovorax sp. YR266]